MMKPLRIIKRGYGIADRYPDGTIEINKHLDDYPDLKMAIIQHEIDHTDNPKFNRRDLIHDITTVDQYSQWRMAMFIIRHPFSLVQLLPIYYTKRRGLIVDLNTLFMWGVLLTLVSVTVWFRFLV